MPDLIDIARNGATRGGQPGALVVETRRLGDVAIVEPSGELDLATVETLWNALNAIEPTSRLVLDLRGLRFIDSSGLHLLTALDRRAKDDGVQLNVIAPAPPVDRAIRLCGLDRALPFVSDLQDVAAVG